jgi:hypothetical protein
MKKLFLAITIAASFVACKSKESEIETNKELLLQDASMSNSAYLSDTGMISSAAMRGGTVTAAPTNNITSTPAPRRSTSTRRSSGTYSNSSSSGAGTSTASTGTTTTAPEKKGISKAAKGAIIGGVGGAVAGAVIGKGGKGAVIGGVVGAAGGYILGRSKDRKDGRVQ